MRALAAAAALSIAIAAQARRTCVGGDDSAVVVGGSYRVFEMDERSDACSVVGEFRPYESRRAKARGTY